ncbi:MAG: TrkA family potassium uptake protein, partial [Gammaproteobacteria bacterium]|nr:TrkA family potassium uptake protein [Gammaproteobacteria bacterium]
MKNVLIIGLGEFGKHLAMKLNQLKCEVCVIDQKAEIINMVQSDFANAYTGDCMNIHVLEELGIKDFDSCVVAIGQNFQASLEITSHLKELGAKYIISKASSEIQSKFLLLAGANETVYPERDIAEKVAIKCNATNLLDYVKLSDEYSIYEIAVLNSWVGHNLKDLDIRNKYEINIVAIRNGKDITVPTAEYIFNSD